MRSNFENQQSQRFPTVPVASNELVEVQSALRSDLEQRRFGVAIAIYFTIRAHNDLEGISGADNIIDGYSAAFDANQRLRDAELARDETEAHLMDVQHDMRSLAWNREALSVLGRWKADQYSDTIAEYREPTALNTLKSNKPLTIGEVKKIKESHIGLSNKAHKKSREVLPRNRIIAYQQNNLTKDEPEILTQHMISPENRKPFYEIGDDEMIHYEELFYDPKDYR
jgi:hypothetical protein